MKRLCAVVAAGCLLLLCLACGGHDRPLWAQDSHQGHAHAHRHGHDHGDADHPSGHAQADHAAVDQAAVRGLSFYWLGAYCVVIIVASLLGGWLPQWFLLTHNRMQVAISLICGLMLGIGVFHMLPHALVELGPSGPDLAAHGMMAGLIVMFLLLRAFHFHHHGTMDSFNAETSGSACQHHDHDHDHDHDHHFHGGPTSGHAGPAKLNWIGVFLGMAFHSVSDGLALGASMEADALHGATSWMGLGTFLAVVLHKPVDSISITTLMTASGWSNRSRTIVNAAFSLICPLGALLFVLGVQQFSEKQALVVGVSLAVSAGVFICIALADLLPEMEFHSHNRTRLTLALLAGVLIAWGIRFLEPPHSHSHGGGAGDHAGHNH